MTKNTNQSNGGRDHSNGGETTDGNDLSSRRHQAVAREEGETAEGI